MKKSTIKLFKGYLYLPIILILLSSCASGYQLISPEAVKYVSVYEENGVSLAYKYELLEKKYAKKEFKKGIRLVAVRITNNSSRDLMFGRDIRLTYTDGEDVYLMEKEKVYSNLKQSTASYLFYLLLTPINLYTTKSNGFQTEVTSTIPVGLVLGPGITIANMVTSGNANKKFREELAAYEIYGTTVPAGETHYGLIGIRTDSFESLQLKVGENTLPISMEEKEVE